MWNDVKKYTSRYTFEKSDENTQDYNIKKIRSVITLIRK